MFNPMTWRPCALGRMMPLALCAAVSTAGILMLTAAAHGQAQPVPDFHGKWGRGWFGYGAPYIAEDGTVIDGYKNPILKPWPAELVNLKARGLKEQVRRIAIPHTTCWPEGVPGVFGLRQMEIIQTATEIVIFYEDDHHVRHIYLNQPHSKDAVPSWLGESVGHFEGDTLVVDTTGFAAKPQASVDRHGTPVTEGLHVVERYRLVDHEVQERPVGGVNQGNAALDTLDMKGKTLELSFTVEDPAIFHKPWSSVVGYKPDRRTTREVVCAENNRAYADLLPVASIPDF
jgi:hypothetical protein